MLTAIVISFGVTALLLALAYRSWLLTRDDEVQDDVDDRNVGARLDGHRGRRRGRRCRSTRPSPSTEQRERQRATADGDAWPGTR